MSLCTCLFTTLTATSRDPFSCKVFIHPFRHCQTSPTKKWTSSWFYELSLAFFISLPKLVSSLIIWRRHTMTLHKILNLIIILIVLYTLSTLLLFPLPVFVCSFSENPKSHEISRTPAEGWRNLDPQHQHITRLNNCSLLHLLRTPYVRYQFFSLDLTYPPSPIPYPHRRWAGAKSFWHVQATLETKWAKGVPQ